MLKTMRKNVKALKPILWFVVGAFIVSIFVYWGASGKLTQDNKLNALITVGREKISAETYFNALRGRIDALKAEYKEINRSFIEQLNIPQQVLEQLVEQALLLDLAKTLRLRASDEEVRARVMALPGLQQDGKFVGYEAYRRALQYNRIKIGEFEDSLRKEIILSKTIQLLTAGLAVTPEEVWDNYKKNADSAKIETMILETSKVTLDKAPAPAEVQAYFEGRKEAYKIPEKREALAVFLKTEDLRKEIELSDADLVKYYNDNKAQFENPETIQVSRIWMPFAGKDKTQVDGEAKAVLDRLQKGEDFAALAKAFSKDDKAKDGGDYGLYDWRSLPAPEQDEVNKLDAGKFSDLIVGTDGVAIVKVVQKTTPTTTPVDEAKPKIRPILLDQKARELAASRIAKIEKEAKSAKSLEAAAKAVNLKTESTGLLKSGEAWGDLDPSGSVGTALFGLKDKEISAPLYTFSGVGLVELRKIEAPRPATFEEVKSDVETALTNDRKKEKALAVLKDVKAKLTEKNWEDLATKNKLEIKAVDAHKREQYIGVIGESKDADTLAFTLPLKQASEPFAFESGYALLRVLERKEGTKEEFEKTKAAETDQVLGLKKNKFLQSYLAKLRTDRGVKVRYDQFLQLTQDVLSRYDEVK
jgi:peptidyl-prolyl cis-trans isomerase D